MERRSSKKIKEQKAITLIALVITIVVLLILASVSIAMLTGENGLLTKATNAEERTALKNADEAMKLVVAEWKIEKNVGKMTLEEFLNSKVSSELDAYEKISDNEYELEKKWIFISNRCRWKYNSRNTNSRSKTKNIKYTNYIRR